MSIIEAILYLCKSDRRVDDGNVLADLNGPRFRAKAIECDRFAVGSPMFNPWGQIAIGELQRYS